MEGWSLGGDDLTIVSARVKFQLMGLFWTLSFYTLLSRTFSSMTSLFVTDIINPGKRPSEENDLIIDCTSLPEKISNQGRHVYIEKLGSAPGEQAIPVNCPPMEMLALAQ